MSKKTNDRWYSWGKSPKNFRFISNDNGSRFYSYDVPVFLYDKKIDNINILVKYNYNDYGEFISPDVDNNYLVNYLYRNIGVHSEYRQYNFLRDKIVFPFIEKIIIMNNDYDNYLSFKKLKNRKEKILKLKNLTK